MFKIFKHITSRETKNNRFQEESRRIQAKKEKRLRRQLEAERFWQQRQAVNDAAFPKKEQ